MLLDYDGGGKEGAQLFGLTNFSDHAHGAANPLS